MRGRYKLKVKMKLPYSNKDRVLKRPYYLAVNLWVRLDEGIQLLTDGCLFQKSLNNVDIGGVTVINVIGK